MYVDKISEAIAFAVETHELDQKQKRKGKDIPYITHPLTVGIILAHAGAGEDVIVAGVLHDTIEDSIPEKKVTRAMLAERFGEIVAELVDSVTEQDTSLPRSERKRAALEHIKDFSHDSLLIKAADTISNVTELLADHAADGDDTFPRFKATKEDVVGDYLKVIRAVVDGWPESPLAPDLNLLEPRLKTLL